jgi:DmsE family decaheme c-type cytochrome
MSRHVRKLGPNSWLAAGFIVWVVAFGSVRAAEQPTSFGPAPGGEISAPTENPPPDLQSGQAAQAATYVGEDTCLTCHDQQRQGYENSPHHRAVDPRTPAARQGCESCHGPGSRHIEDPTSVPLKVFSRMTPAEVTETCTTCHNRGEHALWDGSQHEVRDVSCTTCHSVHSYKSEAFQLKETTQREVCANCHRDKISKLDRSGHMPVREGKMECTTCHNVHGATNVRLLRKGDSIGELCASCHADKRGPFLWEHPPSRDGCVTCHDPHGSSNERMLVAKPPILCQRCHIHTRHPSTIYDAALVQTQARVFGRSCVTCHSAIHGSNHPSGSRFIR